ncbi:hypothetical protein XPA_004479 [Xanthoria parietina]
MPHAVRQVDFAPIPAYSRLPRSDELYVMKAFARHAGHCSTCAHPYEVHHSGGTLCSKGHQRALDVAQYIYNKGGQSFSLVDRDGNQCVQVEIPADCEAVRSLLKAMERGLRLRRKVQPTSYDKTYHIPPRGRVPSGLAIFFISLGLHTFAGTPLYPHTQPRDGRTTSTRPGASS